MSNFDFVGRGDPGDAVKWVKPAAAVLGLVLLSVIVFRSYYTVDPNEEAVVLRWGKYHATTTAGLHFCIPFVDRVLKVSIEEHNLRLPLNADGRRSQQITDEDALMLTGDLNAAMVEWSVQWKVQEPREYLFSFYNPANDRYVEDVVRIAALTVMNRLVGDYSIDEVLTEKRSEISAAAREATQQILNHYACGVAITDLQMQRVTPPSQVKPAFANVNAAVQLRDQLENEANKERNKLIPAARADRDKKIREAEGYADRRRAEVNGEINALEAKFAAYEKAPQVTRERLYLEAMQTILSQVRNKTIIDADLQQILPLLQLGSEAGK